MTELAMKAYLFGSLFTLSNRLQIAGDALDEKMTVKQWLLVAILYKSEEKELSLSSLAQRMGSSRQNVKKMVSLLAKQGFLSITQKADDKRYLMIRPTVLCLEHCKGREAEEEMFITTLFSDFTREDLESLLQGFALLSKNIETLEHMYASKE